MYNGTTGKKIFDAFNIQGRWNNKKARGACKHAPATKGTSI